MALAESPAPVCLRMSSSLFLFMAVDRFRFRSSWDMSGFKNGLFLFVSGTYRKQQRLRDKETVFVLIPGQIVALCGHYSTFDLFCSDSCDWIISKAIFHFDEVARIRFCSSLFQKTSRTSESLSVSPTETVDWTSDSRSSIPT